MDFSRSAFFHLSARFPQTPSPLPVSVTWLSTPSSSPVFHSLINHSIYISLFPQWFAWFGVLCVACGLKLRQFMSDECKSGVNLRHSTGKKAKDNNLTLAICELFLFAIAEDSNRHTHCICRSQCPHHPSPWQPPSFPSIQFIFYFLLLLWTHL